MSDFLEALDRAALEIFVDLMNGRHGNAHDGRIVANLGSGAGHVTAYLNWLGVDSFGVDVTQDRVMRARQEYPKLSFVVGQPVALEMRDAVLRGLVAWRCFDPLNATDLEAAILEFDRVLSSGGSLLFAFSTGRTDGKSFFAGDDRASFEQATQALRLAGFIVDGHMIHEPETDEHLRHVFLMAHKGGRAPSSRRPPC